MRKATDNFVQGLLGMLAMAGLSVVAGVCVGIVIKMARLVVHL